VRIEVGCGGFADIEGESSPFPNTTWRKPDSSAHEVTHLRAPAITLALASTRKFAALNPPLRNTALALAAPAT
jgi:hypothetical protein